MPNDDDDDDVRLQQYSAHVLDTRTFKGTVQLLSVTLTECDNIRKLVQNTAFRPPLGTDQSVSHFVN